MELHELRVGNWVYEDKNPQDVGNPIGPWIYQIQAKDIQFADWYEPIPLDEKWLKRAGFERVKFAVPETYIANGWEIKRNQKGWYFE